MNRPTSTKGSVPTGFADEIVISESTFRNAHRAVISASQPNRKRKREERGDSSKLFGPNAYKGPWAKYKEDTLSDSSEDDDDSGSEQAAEEGADAEKPVKFTTDYQPEEAGETTEFHGSEQYDYQGRTYMHVPLDLDIDLTGDASEIKNYIPKKLLHTWRDQAGAAVTQMRFFPSSGHLLLSASASGKVKLFDVFHDRELLRSYTGHNRSCNDVDFTPDGVSFLSSSLDRQMKLWDTETGASKGKFTTGKTPHVIRFNPGQPHEFLAGMSDKKIVQFDTRSGEQVQEYDHHLGPVNTITFCDENRRFITTSDDRSLRAWEYGVPVPIKFIAEPHMFSMNRSAHHPSKEFAAFQSSDNQIVVYSSADRFRQNRKKSFRGHNNAGYAIDVDFSTDGDYVISGDTGGYLAIWSWKTCKLLDKIQAAEGPLLSTRWHPREKSGVVTGDLSGIIKYWI